MLLKYFIFQHGIFKFNSLFNKTCVKVALAFHLIYSVQDFITMGGLT